MKTATTNTELNNFIEVLQKNGFIVIAPKEPSTYIKAFKGGAFIYIQADRNFRYNGTFSFSTVNKPSKENGTGAGFLEGAELTIENVNKTVGFFNRYNGYKAKFPVKKYASIEEYLKNNSIGSIMGWYIVTPLKPSKFYTTHKPDETIYNLYDFARSAEQAKNMLESLKEAGAIAHKSTSQGGLYNIYVTKKSNY